MTPRTGLRFPSRPFVQAACASGLFWLSACGHSALEQAAADADPSEPSRRARGGSAPKAQQELSPDVEESLARLNALELLEVSGVYETRTVHSWIPYGGYWAEHQEQLSEDEVATRLETFVDTAEAALDADPQPIDNDTSALCWGPVDDEGSFCLTRDMHQADLDALDALEIVHVEGMVRDFAIATGACYSSWDTVSEADCDRAHRVRALVEATADFERRDPPAGEEQP